MGPALPVRWSDKLPADISPFNCTVGGPAPAPADLEALEGAEWPSAQASASAGPTGAPWVTSNGWRIRIARHRQGANGRWPMLDTAPKSASHALAVADAMAYGGVWLARYDPSTWAEVTAAVRFYAKYAGRLAWAPVAALAVIGEFGHPFEEEFVNLLARRQVGFELLKPGDRSKAPHSVDLRRVPRDDPYAAVAATHLRIGRKSDVLRLWNGGAINTHYTASGAQGLCHLVNYTGRRAAHDVSVWFARRWRSASLATPEGTTALPVRPVNGGIEIPLPPVAVFATIELEA